MQASVKRIQIIIIFFNIVWVCLVGCRKFVEISPPSTQIVTPSVFSDDNAATAALTNIYSAMTSDSWNMSQNAGLLSDELETSSVNPGVVSYFHDDLAGNTTLSFGPWVQAYNCIYQSNAVIYGIKTGKGMTPAIERQLTGEAEFIRAFWYFYLINCYGDVPLVLSTDYKINSTLSRAPKAKVYEQIISDLNDAYNLLNINYVDGSDTTVSTERIRPNKAAAAALLARVYLYTNDYVNAEKKAELVISDGQFQLVQDLSEVFLMNSAEAIWQLGAPSTSIYSTVDGFNYILTAAPATGDAGGQAVTISDQLMNSFEPNDQRKATWIGSITFTNPDTTYYYPFKYKSNTLPVSEYVMMLRLSEQYLIHAEALARQDKQLDQAVADINNIRKRAGLDNYKGPLNKDSILPVVLHERQVELFTEWGHRWFDLIRAGNVNAVMSVVTPIKGGGAWESWRELFPIPQSEIAIDFNLTQNPGYN